MFINALKTGITYFSKKTIKFFYTVLTSVINKIDFFFKKNFSFKELKRENNDNLQKRNQFAIFLFSVLNQNLLLNYLLMNEYIKSINDKTTSNHFSLRLIVLKIYKLYFQKFSLFTSTYVINKPR